MIRTQHPRPARPGFTLVELMVAAAICVIIMTILAVCFQTGIDAMREMRSAGDMADQLRSAEGVMKRDFQADHFLSVENVPGVLNQGKRLSDYQFQSGATAASVRGGFYQITSPAGTYEGSDGSFDSTRANSHSVWFTSVLPGGSDANLYSAVSPAGSGTVYSSQAAEVAYFLAAPVPTFTSGGVPLYNLYRRQRLVALDLISQAALQSAVASDPNAYEVFSLNTATTPATVNTMFDVTANGGKRPGSVVGAGPAPVPLTGGRFGDDILLSNVISFEVKPTWVPGANTAGPRAFTLNTDYPYDTLRPQLPSPTFDTATSPPPIRVIGLQVRVRVYDPKLKSARQATYIFAQ